MKPLRTIRHEHADFDPRFFERHPDFWPIARAAKCFATEEDWPAISSYGRAFAVDEPPVRFIEAPVKRKRPDGVIDRESLYDAMIVSRREVSTRARMWHDFLNALVWMTFPRAKLALHRRQHRAIEQWIPQGATHLPNARTRELDALALVDEGGVVILEEAAHGGTQRSVVFGHALYEGLVFGRPAMAARALVLSLPRLSDDDEESIAMVDAHLSELLDDGSKIVSPDELPRSRIVSGGWVPRSDRCLDGS